MFTFHIPPNTSLILLIGCTQHCPLLLVNKLSFASEFSASVALRVALKPAIVTVLWATMAASFAIYRVLCSQRLGRYCLQTTTQQLSLQISFLSNNALTSFSVSYFHLLLLWTENNEWCSSPFALELCFLSCFREYFWMSWCLPF